MAAVWKRPSLTALEIAWRWGVGAPLLALAAWETMRVGRMVAVNRSALQAMTVFQPVAMFGTIGATLDAVAPAADPVLRWFAPLALVVWMVAGALGRALVMRRLNPLLAARLHGRPATLVMVGGLRVLVLAAVWALWVGGVRWAGRVAITGPAQHGAEPSVVAYCALLISGTLGLFMAWAVGSWLLHLAPVVAMLRGEGAVATLRSALQSGPLRSKLIEINLVMGIAKIAVLVLAMVFSACPLPFATVETQTFLVAWWCGVVLVYLAALDYFHVVRTVAYVALWRMYRESEPGDKASAAI
jgi:hypothetical protein